jgi:hypothetical protein
MVFLLCKNDLESKEREVSSYVLKNRETLTHMASTALYKGSESVALIEGVNDVSCWDGSGSYVDFNYYSIGIGSTKGIHYGFYYSPEDTPAAYGAQDVILDHDENGWSWNSGDDSYGYTKKIMDNWYYYETSF